MADILIAEFDQIFFGAIKPFVRDGNLIVFKCSACGNDCREIQEKDDLTQHVYNCARCNKGHNYDINAGHYAELEATARSLRMLV